MFPDKFMRFNFEAEPKSSRYSLVIGLSLLHVFTNPVVRRDFGAPLKHKSGIDSWILLHPDERERRCKLTLYIVRLQRVEVACVSVHMWSEGCVQQSWPGEKGCTLGSFNDQPQ